MRPAATVTRRQLLQRAAAVGAAPYVITSAALGGPDRAPASERVTTGHIGIGGMGGGHLSACARHPRTQVLAVCDVDAARRGRAKWALDKRHKGTGAYNDFRELLARDDVDAVFIATPDHWHAIPAIEAARSGKDVYCEKPLTLTIREARAVVDAVRRHGRVCQAGTQKRSDTRVRRACELVRSGRIGKLLRVHVSFPHWRKTRFLRRDALPSEPVPDGLDWDLYVGQAPWRPYNRRYHPTRGWIYFHDFSGGHGMTGWGSHHFDIAQWGMGMDHTGPVEVLPPDGKDRELLTFRYANGVLLHHGGGGRGVRFVGTEGEILTAGHYLASRPASIARSPLGPDDVHLYDSRSHMGNFLECIRTRKRPIADVAVNCRSVTLCHLANIAYWLDRPLRWDPDRERFAGDPEADRWLGRRKRPPWRL